MKSERCFQLPIHSYINKIATTSHKRSLNDVLNLPYILLGALLCKIRTLTPSSLPRNAHSDEGPIPPIGDLYPLCAPPWAVVLLILHPRGTQGCQLA